MQLRIIALALAMVLGLASAALAASPVAISETTVDFGSMTEGPVASKTVVLTNTGKEAATIENVSTS